MQEHARDPKTKIINSFCSWGTLKAWRQRALGSIFLPLIRLNTIQLLKINLTNTFFEIPFGLEVL